MENRRSTDRTKTSKPASILFGRQTGDHFCEVEVKDLANGGAGIYKSGPAILPLTFELSFDNLRRRCRMVWRRGNFFGVTFEDQSASITDKPEIGDAEFAISESTLFTLGEPPLVADNVEGLAEFVSNIPERTSSGRSDVRFAIGVVVALTLPVLISFGAYLAMTLALSAG